MKYIILALIVVQVLIPTYTETSAYTKKETPRIVQIEIFPSKLHAIADCESGKRLNGKAIEGSATHFNKDGSVKIGQFTDPEFGFDVGITQINTLYHQERAERLGIDLWKQADNEKYARLLFREQGASPWKASFDCHGIL